MQPIRTPNQIAQEIQSQIKNLLGEKPLPINEALLLFNIEALIIRVLDYCNRRDLPRALEMSIIELFFNKINSDINESSLESIDTKALKSIKMGDTEFEFNYGEKSSTEKDVNYFFEQLKSNLNIYRKVRGFK